MPLSKLTASLVDAIIHGNTDEALAALARGADLTTSFSRNEQIGLTTLGALVSLQEMSNLMWPSRQKSFRTTPREIGPLETDRAPAKFTTPSPDLFPLLLFPVFHRVELLKQILAVPAHRLAAEPYINQLLEYCIQHPDLEKAIPILFDAGADVNAPLTGGVIPLMHALTRKRTPALHALVACGARVESLLGLGNELLHAIIAHDYADGVQLLLDHRADVNAKRGKDESPLYFAVGCCRRLTSGTKIIAMLLAKGARVDDADIHGMTPLHLAIELNKLPFAEQLLAAGADPNKAMKNGRTPLHTAAEAGNLAAVRLLHQAGARLDPVQQGGTAEEMAARFGHATVVEYLRNPPPRQSLLAEKDAEIRAQAEELSRLRAEVARLQATQTEQPGDAPGAARDGEGDAAGAAATPAFFGRG